MSAVHIRVTGKVQGVFFRATTVEKAVTLDLKGWVWNCEDGSVEIHAEGNKADLQALEEWCKRGPPTAKVESVIFKPADEEGYTVFATRHE